MSKFENDLQIVRAILSKPAEEITAADRALLLSIYQAPYHDTGKIEGASSCDSSCHGCAFCGLMREAAKGNPLHICGYCYDASQESRWANVKNRHGLNMEIMGAVDFSVEELARLPVTPIIRENSSGDISGDIMARNYVRIAYAHPWARVTLWAKNVAPVERAFGLLGKPENMLFIQSSILIGIPARRSPWADYVFTVYPDEETLQEALFSGAMECNGQKCKDCGWRCYKGLWPTGANIAELLRVPEKRRVEIVKAYRARMEKGGAA